MKAGLEKSLEGQEIGRDPRDMLPGDLEALGHVRMPVLQAIRARCIDCCAGSTQEVRYCTAVACAAWPFRMGTDPWRAKREMSAEDRAALAARLAAGRAKGA